MAAFAAPPPGGYQWPLLDPHPEASLAATRFAADGFVCVSEAMEAGRAAALYESSLADLEACHRAIAERGEPPLPVGLKDGYSRTLEEVGRQFQVTRERIRQIEAKALRKMRHPTRIRKLEGFIELPNM